ncbi:hypothetical protein [Lewinella sp. W8]|uniref:hypothetical protein n=1 Tax=Lewinella sp. W8 TaxID=2528208 RepID=UPI001068CB77|nr:hypothetical protein [Lewinella sp. W8]MTB49812.1 hypothetical protein [Lewinella sp. W8]
MNDPEEKNESATYQLFKSLAEQEAHGTDQAILSTDFEKLISLAENSSKAINDLNDAKIRIDFGILIMSTTGVVLLTSLFFLARVGKIGISEMNDPQNLEQWTYSFGFAIFLFAFVFFNLFSLRKRIRIINQIRVEKRALKRIYDIIYSFKEIAFQRIDIITRATFEMRLERLSFESSTQNDHET